MSDPVPRTGIAWPTPAQELLLKAALGRGPDATEAWRAWKRIDDVQTTDPGSQRLLPLVYRNLTAAGADGPELAKLKGAYRYWWYRNQMLLRGGVGVLRDLAGAGLETMVLKGPALATLYYRDRGTRPMLDFDVLVRFEDALGAMAALRSSGWEPSVPRPESRLHVRHADSFARPNGMEIDLHWEVLWKVGDSDDFWRGAIATELDGVPTKALCAADQLLHVCVHGLRWAPTEPIRWVADAVTVVDVAGSSLDWDRVVRSARRNGLTLAMEQALGYLRETYATPVPSEVLASLAASPRSRVERLEFRAALGHPNRAVHLLMLWDRHRRLLRLRSSAARPPGFVTFLQHHWNLERRSQLPLHVLRKLTPAGLRARH